MDQKKFWVRTVGGGSAGAEEECVRCGDVGTIGQATPWIGENSVHAVHSCMFCICPAGDRARREAYAKRQDWMG